MNRLQTIFCLLLVTSGVLSVSLATSQLGPWLSAGVGTSAAVGDVIVSGALDAEAAPSERCTQGQRLAESGDEAAVAAPRRSAPTTPGKRASRAGGSWQSLLPGSIR